MSNFKSNLIATSAIIATSTLATQLVSADENPFEMTNLSSGYMVADNHGKYCKKKMKRMDTNEDGSVSKDEFMNYMEKKFARKDENGDGVLSADEMKRMKKHREGKCGEGKCGEGKCGEGKCGEKKTDS